VGEASLFLDLIFGRYGLRKVYAEILGIDEEREAKLRYAGFQEEMRLREDSKHLSSYVDYVYFALFSDEWHTRRLPYLAELAVDRTLKGQERNGL
jgi:RimJ/RimL family protein N-acetyltransferase